MVCNKCGTQNADGNKICLNCGNVLEATVSETQTVATEAAEAVQEAPVNEAPATDAPAQIKAGASELLKKITGNKKLLGIIAAVIAVVVILGIIIAACSGGSASSVKGDFSVIYDADAKESHIIYAGKIIAKGIAGEVDLKECQSGEVAVYLDEEKTLYAVTEDGTKKIADDVQNLKALSNDGEKVIYIDADNASVLYNIAKGDKKVFDEDSVYSPVFSANGEIFGYSKYDTEEKDDGTTETVITSYVYTDGESKKVFENGRIGALSDNGKYIYCSKTEEDTSETALYVTNLKGEKKKIASNISDFFTNTDGTQVMFRSENKWYASVKGDEKVRIEGVSSSVSSLYPFNGAAECESFKDSMFIGYADGELSIYKLNSKWTAEKLAGGIDGLDASEDLETIYYLKNDKLYILGEDEAIEDEVVSFVVTSDGDAVYFISEDDTLYYKKGTKDKKRVADDVTKVRITHDDYALFMDEDDTLYASDDGDSPKSLCEEVTRIYIGHDYTYFCGDADSSTGECNIYIASKKINFEKIFTEIKQ